MSGGIAPALASLLFAPLRDLIEAERALADAGDERTQELVRAIRRYHYPTSRNHQLTNKGGRPRRQT